MGPMRKRILLLLGVFAFLVGALVLALTFLVPSLEEPGLRISSIASMAMGVLGISLTYPSKDT